MLCTLLHIWKVQAFFVLLEVVATLIYVLLVLIIKMLQSDFLYHDANVYCQFQIKVLVSTVVVCNRSYAEPWLWIVVACTLVQGQGWLLIKRGEENVTLVHC